MLSFFELLNIINEEGPKNVSDVLKTIPDDWDKFGQAATGTPVSTQQPTPAPSTPAAPVTPRASSTTDLDKLLGGFKPGETPAKPADAPARAKTRKDLDSLSPEIREKLMKGEHIPLINPHTGGGGLSVPGSDEPEIKKMRWQQFLAKIGKSQEDWDSATEKQQEPQAWKDKQGLTPAADIVPNLFQYMNGKDSGFFFTKLAPAANITPEELPEFEKMVRELVGKGQKPLFRPLGTEVLKDNFIQTLLAKYGKELVVKALPVLVNSEKLTGGKLPQLLGIRRNKAGLLVGYTPLPKAHSVADPDAELQANADARFATTRFPKKPARDPRYEKTLGSSLPRTQQPTPEESEDNLEQVVTNVDKLVSVMDKVREKGAHPGWDARDFFERLHGASEDLMGQLKKLAAAPAVTPEDKVEIKKAIATLTPALAYYQQERDKHPAKTKEEPEKKGMDVKTELTPEEEQLHRIQIIKNKTKEAVNDNPKDYEEILQIARDELKDAGLSDDDADSEINIMTPELKRLMGDREDKYVPTKAKATGEDANRDLHRNYGKTQWDKPAKK